MQQYLNLLFDVRLNGEKKQYLNGLPTEFSTLSSFRKSLQFDLSKGFPILTTKYVPFNMVIDELLWFISGSTNVNDLPERTRKIWQPWAKENGELGPIYGKQFRKQEGTVKKDFDQLKHFLTNLFLYPQSRRHVMNLWHTADMTSDVGLPCCHGSVIQAYVREDKTVDLAVYQRSADLFIGVPFNISSYALFLHIIATYCNFKPGILYWEGGDCHIYTSHLPQVEEILNREPKKLPYLKRFDSKPIDNYVAEDFILEDYVYHPPIKADVVIV